MTTPVVTSVDVPSAGTYMYGMGGSGSTLYFTVNWDRYVTVSGTPRLRLTLDSGTVYADYTGGSSSTQLTFQHDIASIGEIDTDGIVVHSLELNGGTILEYDAPNDPANLTLNSVGSTTSVWVGDTTAPTISSVGVPSSGNYSVDNFNGSLVFTVNFDEYVYVTGTPRLSLTIGSTTRYADYTGGSASTQLTFQYDVVLADIDTNGIVVNSLGLNSGTIQDYYGNNADLTLHSVGSTTGVLVGDVTAPAVTSVDVPSSGTYSYSGMSSTLTFTVNFDSYVYVTGTPRLKLLVDVIDSLSPEFRYADYVSGSGSTALTFSHAVQDPNSTGDFDLDGIEVSSLEQDGGSTIRDYYSNDADLTLHSVGGTSAVLINANCPYVDNWVRPWGNYDTGASVDYLVIWVRAGSSVDVDVSGTPRIALSGGRYATYQAGSGSNSLTFRYVVQSGDTGSLSVTGSSIELNGGTIRATDDASDAIRLLRNGTGPTEVTMNYTPVWSSFTDDIPLFVNGIDTDDFSISLMTWGDQEADASLTLVVPDVLGYKTESTTLFVHGEQESTGSIPLHTVASETINSDITLNTVGHVVSTASMPLFVQVDPPGEAESSLLLTITGSLEAGMFAGVPLHTYSDEFGQTPTRSMPLFLMAEDQSSAVAHMNLWVEGRAHAADGSLELVVWNDQEGAYQSIPLFVQGEGETEGALPLTWSMNLVLQRGPANAITLYIQGPGEELTEAMTLFVEGEELSEASLELSLPNVLGYVRQTVPLFTSGF